MSKHVVSLLTFYVIGILCVMLIYLTVYDHIAITNHNAIIAITFVISVHHIALANFLYMFYISPKLIEFSLIGDCNNTLLIMVVMRTFILLMLATLIE